ncbi:hypothetical protein DR980_12505 [Flavobacterium psychrolimnae]|uniref:Lipopolysaccharide biosynthesis protein n=2 Tax=Flavobacterium psychrolimnae TaxID=249351 RepID=A0A366B015_9FLAO|nr:hypothetical protein DR980_12505 [Flavobacterium psychrolimnae]
MFLTMGVGLFTSRLVLDALGVSDYGIYGLVGGMVTMFAFLNSAMASATQRYLSFDIGRNDMEQLQKTFNATLNIHIFIALVILILGETIGLWFINYKLNIPTERLYAVNWVYQFSILTFLLSVIQVPYNALLMAREHMQAYAYLSVVETILKLVIVLLLLQLNADKLVLYAILTFIVSLIMQFVFKYYCKRHFKESVYHFYYDKVYYKELLSYSGWNLFGNIAGIARGQGSNILLNLFFGPVANASYSLTLMVQGVIGNFISNFQIAVNPQIIKNYSKGDTEASLNLMYKSAKFSFFAMLILITPFLANIDYIMNLWLTKVPQFTIEFIQLALIYSLIETLANPLIIGAQATGKIKWYQIVVGTFIFLTLPAIWLTFKITNNPINTFWVLIGNSVIALVFRLLFLKKMMGLNLKDFNLKVLLKVLLVSGTTFILVNIAKLSNATSLFELCYQSVVICGLTVIPIILLGVSKNEKKSFLFWLNEKKFKK